MKLKKNPFQSRIIARDKFSGFWVEIFIFVLVLQNTKYYFAENEKRCTTPLAAAAADMDCDVEEKMRIERSLSPSSSIALSENKETESLRLSPEPISSLDEKDYGFEKRNTEYERTEKASKKDVVSDHLTDNTLKKNEAPNQFEMAVISDKKRRPATNHLNPNLLSW